MLIKKILLLCALTASVTLAYEPETPSLTDSCSDSETWEIESEVPLWEVPDTTPGQVDQDFRAWVLSELAQQGYILEEVTIPSENSPFWSGEYVAPSWELR